MDQARWLDDFVPSGEHQFTKIPRKENSTNLGWHNRSSRNTPLEEWLIHWNQSGDAWGQTIGGCITVFPQLASLIGWRKRFSRKNVPVIAWCFNIGKLYSGIKQSLASAGLREIDQFVVHSKKECETVSSWLKLPESRFKFIPLQRAPIPIVTSEEMDNPFVVAMGSANRDYQTLFNAVKKLGVRTIVVAAQHSIQGLAIPSNVEVRSGLTPQQCHVLAQKARVNIIPLIEHTTGAGQVTIVEAMRMSRPVIATRCVGSEDYIDHGRTGLFVKPYSIDDLSSAIAQLWSDEKLRSSMAKEAGNYAEMNFSDESAGRHLGKILDQLT
ncbi:hypothetical protein CY0110_09997 [Crocosphaera chwakensis CCY0110]|uniref:Glycosyl transferase family 1 domain-containing protein n=2 Tax=Crocosphaera TaxID=263510 RepID=A3IGV6_9CHRO|nr:hypothetical protein CY0110_09997 [Crocosphaera chwakensis CCY0110]